MNDPKTIASLISDTIHVSPEQLLQQFASDNERIYFELFRTFCEEHGASIQYPEFLDLLAADQAYLFDESSDERGQYWVPVLSEGYVINALPGDWSDFGDDQIAGITKPAFGDSPQQQPTDFAPLSNDQISDDPSSTPEIPDVEPEEPDLPDFDTRMRHRPSRSVKELESVEPDAGLIEQDQTTDHGPLIARLYGLVDSWQTGAMDQTSFEQELGKLSSEPTLKNSTIDVWPMVHKILAVRRST